MVTIPETSHPPSVASRQLVLTLLQERDVVNEVDGGVVRTVEAAGSAVILPAEIWVGHVGEISATTPAGVGSIDSRDSV